MDANNEIQNSLVKQLKQNDAQITRSLSVF